jgi:uncharacterized membrane-anchored protein YhcB (DUF1043 family)
MVVLGRLAYLRTRVLCGVSVRITISQPTIGRSKVRFTLEECRPRISQPCFIAIELIEYLTRAALLHITFDHGHRHSDGNSVCDVYFKQLPILPAAPVPFDDDLGNDGDGPDDLGNDQLPEPESEDAPRPERARSRSRERGQQRTSPADRSSQRWTSTIQAAWDDNGLLVHTKNTFIEVDPHADFPTRAQSCPPAVGLIEEEPDTPRGYNDLGHTLLQIELDEHRDILSRHHVLHQRCLAQIVSQYSTVYDALILGASKLLSNLREDDTAISRLLEGVEDFDGDHYATSATSGTAGTSVGNDRTDYSEGLNPMDTLASWRSSHECTFTAFYREFRGLPLEAIQGAPCDKCLRPLSSVHRLSALCLCDDCYDAFTAYDDYDPDSGADSISEMNV